MYIRKTVRRYKDKTYVNYLLVESVLTDKGPRKRVICSLGDLSPRPPEQWLALARKLQDALTGQLSLPGLADEDPELRQLVQALPAGRLVDAATWPSPRLLSADDLVSVHVDRVTVERPRPAGHIHVGREFWKRLGLDEILKSLDFSPPLINLTCAMTLNRLIHPAAEYAMPDWIRSTAMADILGVDFYENLSMIRSIATSIASTRTAARLNPPWRNGNKASSTWKTRFCSTTSPALISRAKPLSTPKPSAATPATIGRIANKSSWGWSSVVKGFLAPTKSSRGTSRIGNRSLRCSTCWRSAWESPKARRSSSTGGWPIAENIAELQRRKLHYLVAAGQKERDVYLAEFENGEGFEAVIRQPSPRNPGQKKSTVRVKKHTANDESIRLMH